jgi:hypothetical protein
VAEVTVHDTSEGMRPTSAGHGAADAVVMKGGAAFA